MSLALYPSGTVSSRQGPVTRIMTGLPNLRGDEHRRQRRLIMPALHGESVRSHHDPMVTAVNDMVDRWRLGDQIDLTQEMLRLTLRISATTLFGREELDRGEHLGHVIEAWIAFVMSLGHLLPYDLPGTPYRRWLRLSAEIEDVTRRLIEEKRASEPDDSLLSRLVRATDEEGSVLSEEDLVGHVSLLLWGSRDASVYAVVWTVFLLSQHPDAAAQVADELEDRVSDARPTREALAGLTSLHRVVQESLRLLPPFPVLHRVASRSNELAGNPVAEGSELALSVYHTQRDADWFYRPAHFMPERWEENPPGPFVFLPFGSGPRMCPGQPFALQEVTIILAVLLSRRRLELASGTRIDRQVDVALTPRAGMPFVVRAADRQFRHGVGGVRGNIHEMVHLPG